MLRIMPVSKSTSPTLNLMNLVPKLSARNRSLWPLWRWTHSERAGLLNLLCAATGMKPPFANVTEALHTMPRLRKNREKDSDHAMNAVAIAIPQNRAQVPRFGFRCHSILAPSKAAGANKNNTR